MASILKIILLYSLLFNSLISYSAIEQYGSTEVARKLRKAILTDPNISEDARKIKIITGKNYILLEGHVSSRAEKVHIENLARARAQKNKVYNRLKY